MTPTQQLHDAGQSLLLDNITRQILQDFARAGIDRKTLAERLQQERADSFDQSWKSLLACVASKHDQLTKADRAGRARRRGEHHDLQRPPTRPRPARLESTAGARGEAPGPPPGRVVRPRPQPGPGRGRRVIGSWLLDLTAAALLESPALEEFPGRVPDSGEGRWSAIAAIEEGVPAATLASALLSRFGSRDLDRFANQVLSAMRKQFGGHAEKPAR